MDIDSRRHLAIEGTRNVRDLGGYETRDGRQTRWGRFLRSDGLQGVTAAGREKLLGLGLKTVVDLRRGSELAVAPSVFAAPDALPALYNCAAGKDRTGVTSAMLLSVAGVDDDLIAADYTLSAHFLLGRHLGVLAAEGNAKPEFSEEDYRREFVPAAAMLRVMRHLRDEYGGAESYMRTVGLQDEQIERLCSGLLDD